MRFRGAGEEFLPPASTGSRTVLALAIAGSVYQRGMVDPAGGVFEKLAQARDSAAMALLRPFRRFVPPAEKIIDFKKRLYDRADLSGEAASDAIYEELDKPKPSMIARFGSVELDCLVDYHYRNFSLSGCKRFIRSEIEHIGLSPVHQRAMANNAGFFSNSPSHLKRFSRRMIADMREVDILGTWMEQEKVFEPQLKDAVKVRLRDLEPYFHEKPWSRILAGKRVLVVHPFKASILRQFGRRERLYGRPDILPPFDLEVVQAVQTIAGTPTSYKSWFEALEFMMRQIEQSKFEIALIGCGSYGFPLAAHVKRMGRKAVHMGGALQMLFGIKGKRWERKKQAAFFNEHWISPLEEDRPENFQRVERGCYW